MVIPFLLFSSCTFFFIKNKTEDYFISTMTRITENTAQGSVDHQVSEIKRLIQSVAQSLNGYNLKKYLSPEHNEINSIIPSIINSNDYFKASVVSDLNGNYRTYPSSVSLAHYNPQERPWYPKYGIKEEIYFSNPYFPVTRYPKNNELSKSISVSMNLFNDAGELRGNVALRLDLESMSQILQHKIIPYNGIFEVASRDGSVILHPNTREIFKRFVPLSWIKRADRASGYFFDEDTKQFVFYQSYNNPDWLAFTVVSQDSHKQIFSSAYVLFYMVFAGCLVMYLILLLLSRVYIKQLLHMLFMNIHGIECSNEKATFEHIASRMRDKNKEIERAEDLSLTDGLMGIGTRRKFDRDILEYIQSNRPFYLAMIDLDNFKSINDTYGHHTGDLVLKLVCRVGIDNLEQVGTLYRYGGEEIAVLLPGCSYEKSEHHLEQWRLTVSQRQWREENLQSTFSCGLAAWQVGETPEMIVEKVDKLLYTAKHNGKNCIVGVKG